MTVRLSWMLGTIHDSKRAAALLAIKANDDVVYEFQDKDYTITLAEAKELLPKLIEETFQELDNFKNRFLKSFDHLQKSLAELMEAALTQ